MSKNKIKIIIGILSTIILLLGGTYAAWNFLTEKTSVTMLVGGDQILFDAGTNITIDKILPVYSMEDGITKDIEIYKEDGDYTAGIDLYLNLKTWPTYMSSTSFRWAVYKNGAYLSSGDFSNTSQGNNIKLTSYTQKINLEEKKDSYRLYLWIDAYQESNINMMNRQFTVNLYGQVSFYTDDEGVVNETEPNEPDLAEGMIPIKYNYVLDEWVKADVTNANNDWYDYYSKIWANAVMVESDKREEYMNAPIGTTVAHNDILAYYVWIPRYKYVLFNVDSGVIDPVEIKVEFQKETDEIFNGTQNGEYLTHPAFWWDNNSNRIREEGEELAGIWFGKFETTKLDDNLTILPNVAPLYGESFKEYYTMFNEESHFESTYYLTESGINEVDAHMTKNTEWGSVTYLTHSRYGINGKVKKNTIDYRTGGTENYTYNDFYINNGTVTTNKEVGKGVSTSTTGNVYGIYDMVGGRKEYIMGIMKTAAGNIAYSQFEKKYYDEYEYGTNDIDFTRRILGDATGEVRGWYNSVSKFVGQHSYFIREGVYDIGTYHGGDNIYASARSTVVLP